MRIGRHTFILILFNLFLIILNKHVHNTTSLFNGIPLIKQIEEFKFSFLTSFLQSFLLIIFSEIGDNTFILCLIFSKQLPHLTIFFIALLSLLSMNLISFVIGYCLPFLIYKKIVDWFAILIFVIYGVWLLDESTRIVKVEDTKIDAESNQEPEKSTQIRKVESGSLNYYFSTKSHVKISNPGSMLIIPEYIPTSEYMIKEDEENTFIKTKVSSSHIVENLIEEEENKNSLFFSFFSSIFIGECGDRSQICTIAISSIFDPLGVVAGTSLAYLVGVFMSIYFGNFITSKVSEKLITIICGVLLLVYSVEIYFMKL